MKLAINYSPQAAALLEERRIHVDLLKCPDWPGMIAEAQRQRPVYVHFPLMAGRAELSAIDWAQIDRLFDSTETLYLNAHLAPNIADHDFPINTLDEKHSQKLIHAMLADIKVLVRRYGADRVILENGMWDIPFGIPLAALQPEVICRVVYETGCGFLMDTAHAAVTCRHFSMDAHEYIDQLPTDRLCELHVTGTVIAPDGMWSDHEAMRDYDWDLLNWSMTCIHDGRWARPWVIAFEYGGVGPFFGARSDHHVIEAQVPRLLAACRAVSAVVTPSE